MISNLRLLFGLILKNPLLSTIKVCSGIIAGTDSGWCEAKRKSEESERRDLPSNSRANISIVCSAMGVGSEVKFCVLFDSF